jgi:hypothetical protein
MIQKTGLFFGFLPVLQNGFEDASLFHQADLSDGLVANRDTTLLRLVSVIKYFTKYYWQTAK